MTTTIYALCDRENVIRYVGMTTMTLAKRLYGHLSEARYRKNKSHRINWINQCVAEGYTPTIRTLEVVEGNGSQAEREWIKMLKEFCGADLVNGTDGGECGTLCEAAREKLRQANLGKKQSEEQRRANGLRKAGTIHAPETRIKMSAAHRGKVISDEQRQKLAEASAQRSPEARLKSRASCSKTKGLRRDQPDEYWRLVALAREMCSSGSSYAQAALATGFSRSYVAGIVNGTTLRDVACGEDLKRVMLEMGQKVSRANTGRQVSPETLAKLRQANLGRKMSPEARAKIGRASRGRKDSPKTTERRRLAKIGKKKSPETIERMRVAQRSRRAAEAMLKV